MKVKIVVCVFDRYYNLKRWIEAWKMCEQKRGNNEAELVIIHNLAENDNARYQKLCEENNVRYIPRKNIGYDIGAMQDVCRQRIKLDYDYLLWCSDDTYPMAKDFVWQFVEKLNDKVGVSCMEISDEEELHVRTTGFCITRETAERLEFPRDTITTKNQCYYFEHRGESYTLMGRIMDMGLAAVEVAPLEHSPLWDSGREKHKKNYFDRMDEHYEEFPTKENKVTFICTIFNTFPEIVSSLICQAYKNWELILIHDGRNTTGLRKYLDCIDDKRITYIERQWTGKWGHPHRRWALQQSFLDDTDFVVIGNSDNHLSPKFCEVLLGGFYKNPNMIAAYTSLIAHNYWNYEVLPTQLKLGHVDCGQVMIRKYEAVVCGWRSYLHSSDWTYFSDIIERFGNDKWLSVKGLHFIHH